MSIFDDWYTHRVDVETLTGTDEWGAQTFEPHTAVECLIDAGGVQMARDRNGEQVVSTTRLYLPLPVEKWFTPDSVVTVRGVRTQVIGVSVTEGDPDLNGVVATLK